MNQKLRVILDLKKQNKTKAKLNKSHCRLVFQSCAGYLDKDNTGTRKRATICKCQGRPNIDTIVLLKQRSINKIKKMKERQHLGTLMEEFFRTECNLGYRVD